VRSCGPGRCQDRGREPVARHRPAWAAPGEYTPGELGTVGSDAGWLLARYIRSHLMPSRRKVPRYGMSVPSGKTVLPLTQHSLVRGSNTKLA
jgi:hypothetical protein